MDLAHAAFERRDLVELGDDLGRCRGSALGLRAQQEGLMSARSMGCSWRRSGRTWLTPPSDAEPPFLPSVLPACSPALACGSCALRTAAFFLNLARRAFSHAASRFSLSCFCVLASRTSIISTCARPGMRAPCAVAGGGSVVGRALSPESVVLDEAGEDEVEGPLASAAEGGEGEVEAALLSVRCARAVRSFSASEGSRAGEVVARVLDGGAAVLVSWGSEARRVGGGDSRSATARRRKSDLSISASSGEPERSAERSEGRRGRRRSDDRLALTLAHGRVALVHCS